MSEQGINQPDQTAKSVAVLTVCIAQTLTDLNPDFLPLFEKRLNDIYSRIRDNSYFPSETLQTVRLVSDLLK